MDNVHENDQITLNVVSMWANPHDFQAFLINTLAHPHEGQQDLLSIMVNHIVTNIEIKIKMRDGKVLSWRLGFEPM